MALHRPTDRGRNWVPVLGPAFPTAHLNQKVRGCAVFGDTILACSQFIGFRSVDKGNSWTPIPDFLLEDVRHFFAHEGRYYAWGGNSIFRSQDSGANWQKVYFTATPFELVCPTTSGIYAFNKIQASLIRTQNHFAQQELYFVNMPFIYEEVPVCFYAYNDTLEVGISDANAVAVCAAKKHASFDNGKTWSFTWAPDTYLPFPDIRDWLSVNGRLLLASSNGVFVTTTRLGDAQPSNTGIHRTPIYDFVRYQGQNYAISPNRVQQFGPDQTWQPADLPQVASTCQAYLEYHVTKQRKVFQINGGYHTLSSCYVKEEGGAWTTGEVGRWATTNHCLWRLEEIDLLQRLRDGHTDWESIPIGEAYWGDSTEYALWMFGRGDHLVLQSTKQRVLVLDEAAHVLIQTPPMPCPFSWVVYDKKNLITQCSNETYIYDEATDTWHIMYLIDWSNGVPLHFYGNQVWEWVNGYSLIGTERGIFIKDRDTDRCFPFSPRLPEAGASKLYFASDTLWAIGSETGRLYSLPLRLGENETTITLSATPNPSTGLLQLTSSKFLPTVSELSILDVSGKKIKEIQLQPGNQWTYSFPDLPQGLYFLLFLDESKTKSLKWIKL